MQYYWLNLKIYLLYTFNLFEKKLLVQITLLSKYM